MGVRLGRKEMVFGERWVFVGCGDSAGISICARWYAEKNYAYQRAQKNCARLYGRKNYARFAL